MPREEEMLPKDKYTIFDRKERKYRKGIHSTLALQIVLGIQSADTLTSRTAKVDEIKSENQSSWFLSPVHLSMLGAVNLTSPG